MYHLYCTGGISYYEYQAKFNSLGCLSLSSLGNLTLSEKNGADRPPVLIFRQAGAEHISDTVFKVAE